MNVASFKIISIIHYEDNKNTVNMNYNKKQYFENSN